MALVHFLLVFDHSRHSLVSQTEFSDATDATDAYADAETRHRDDAAVEVVLIGADSIETVRQTHAAYFDATVTTSRYLVGA